MCLKSVRSYRLRDDSASPTKNDIRELGRLGTGVLGFDGTVNRSGDFVLCDEVTLGELDLARYTPFDRLPTPPSGINAGCTSGNGGYWTVKRIPVCTEIGSIVCEVRVGLEHQSAMAEAGSGLRWRIEAAGGLGQRLFLFFVIALLLYIVVAEGCAAGKRRWLLEADCAGVV